MARPKKEPGTLSAKERIEEAFWELLVEMPYDQITIGALSRRASINHNTFYYYFKSMDAMAADIVERTVFPEVPSLVMTGLASGTLDTDALLEHEEYRRYFQRICLLAGAHSTPRIVDRLKEAALSVWMSSLNVRLDDLGKQQRFLVAFLVGANDDAVIEAKREALSSSIAEASRSLGVPIALSVGVARYPQDGATYQELFDAADRAMYDEKNEGRVEDSV